MSLGQAPARSAFALLEAQVLQLQRAGSLSPTQAQTLLSLAQQLQLPPPLRQAPSLGNEDRSSTIAVTNTGRRRREVRWDASAAPRLHSPPARGPGAAGPEDADDNDAASAAAQAPSEYAHSAIAEPGEEEEEDDDVDEEGADFDTAEGHGAADDAAPDALMRQAVPPRGGGGSSDAAASDLPGPARYALPGDDMDAAGEAECCGSALCLPLSPLPPPLPQREPTSSCAGRSRPRRTRAGRTTKRTTTWTEMAGAGVTGTEAEEMAGTTTGTRAGSPRQYRLPQWPLLRRLPSLRPAGRRTTLGAAWETLLEQPQLRLWLRR